ncbi:nucleoid-associated protein [Alistipes sp. ZOR0009]|uniref:nucleoid-associated protein n=1 Tax=Alistipes sp. ZOR0009 TaxID=1339253 RepID=UPI00064818A4|nr:nucleoid-associated protein [Alistipes sp. ZOR0009]
MIELTEARIEKLIIHKVGNPSMGEVKLSKSPISLPEDDFKASILMHYLLSQFRNTIYYRFSHQSDLSLNFVYGAVKLIFEKGGFATISIGIAEYLQEVSQHPKIKNGELYIAKFKDIICDGEICNAIGIFKSESTETFLKIRDCDGGLDIDAEVGININKLDKACLILETSADDGYKVLAANNSEADFWYNDFLNITHLDDSRYKTLNYMTIVRSFVTNVFNGDNDVESIDQAVMLNKTTDFFRKNENFEEEAFMSEVLEQPEIIDTFKEYKDHYQASNAINLDKSFAIDRKAAKNAAKKFKSVIKLDKNFHIYLHGDHSRIERGFDVESKRNYYKLYFDSEAI